MGRVTGVDSSVGGGVNEQGVNASGEAKVFAVQISEFESASAKGGSYNWSSGIVDIDATDTVLLLKNTSQTPLKIESITIWNGSVASEYQVHIPTTEVASPVGTAVTATNLNTGSTKAADATAFTDETTNVQGNIVFTPMLAVDSNISINTVGLQLAQNQSVAVDVVAETTESGVTIRGHY